MTLADAQQWAAIVQIVYGLIALAFAGRIVWRIGFSPLWLLATLVPFVSIVLFWLLAFVDWPISDAKELRDDLLPYFRPLIS